MVVGAQGGSAGGSSSQRPVHTSLGGWGVMPKRWMVLKEGLQGAASRNGPGTTTSRNVTSCPRGSRCSSRAHWGRWSVLQEGLPGVAVPNGLGTSPWGDGESCPCGGQC